MSVNGIGGVFLFSENPKRLAQWYWEHLGVEFEGDGTGQSFYKRYLLRDARDPGRELDETFAILQAKVPVRVSAPEAEPEDMYGDQPYMLNLRIDDLAILLQRLESQGVPILKREDYPYGRFAWVRDADGNRLELYQPLPPA